MKRKRTSRIDLAAMRKSGMAGVGLVTAIASPVGLQGCSEPTVPANAYTSANECWLYRKGCDDPCVTAFNRAAQDAAANGPRYRTQLDCEYDFGAYSCARDQRGGYGPVMRGFLIPADTACNTAGGSGSYGFRTSRALFSSERISSPGYQHWLTSDGRDLGALNQHELSVPKSALSPQTSDNRILSRGGFGNTVRNHNRTSHFSLGG